MTAMRALAGASLQLGILMKLGAVPSSWVQPTMVFLLAAAMSYSRGWSS